MTATRLQRITLLGLLALVPLGVYWFTFDGLGAAAILSVACTLVIVGSLWVMMSSDHGHGVAG